MEKTKTLSQVISQVLRESHEHTAHTSRIIGLKWGTRTVEKCACGAYRTFDVPNQDSPADLDDYAWSAWRRLSG